MQDAFVSLPREEPVLAETQIDAQENAALADGRRDAVDRNLIADLESSQTRR
jgi:hypothetical protein